jgi:hypothetical protein
MYNELRQKKLMDTENIHTGSELNSQTNYYCSGSIGPSNKYIFRVGVGDILILCNSVK